MRLILRQRPAVPKYVRNVTSQAPAPHRIPVPVSAVLQTRAVLTDVLLTPVPPPVALKFVPLVIQHRHRSPVHPPAPVLLLLRLPVWNLSNPPNLRKLNAEKCIRITMSVPGAVVVVRSVTTGLSVCLLPVMIIIIKKPVVHHGNGKRAYR